jgi:hypothetical protein
MGPVHILIFYLLNISSLILFSLLRLYFTIGFFHWDFPTKILFALLIYSMCPTSPAQLILLYLMTYIIFSEEQPTENEEFH